MKWWRWFRRGRLEAQLDAELEDHVERQIADNVQAGLTPAEARRRVLAAFGGVEGVKEACRDVRGTRWLEDLVQDLRYACRFLLKHPAFTLVAVVSLALGIGANATIFSLVDAVLLKTLPVRAPHELVLLSERQISGETLSWSYLQFKQLGESDTLTGLCAFRPRLEFSVAVPGGAEIATGQLVSGNCFDVLGVRAWLGRTLTADDDQAAGARPVAVISHGFWQRHFAGDLSVVGRTVELKGQTITIVGVTPAGFNGLEPGRTVDVTVPFGLRTTLLSGPLASPTVTTSSNVRWLRVIGRLQTGVTADQARADLHRRLQQMARPAAQQQGRLELLPGARGLNDLRQQFSLALRLLMAAVGLLLVAACANLASLMLARARAREREIALRLALGASRSRIVRQLLTEAAVLSTLGGLTGLAIAYWSSHAIVALVSRGRSPIILDLMLDWRLLAFTVTVSIVTSLLFGTWPALWATRADQVGQGLKAPLRVGPSRSAVLVAAQVALSIVLLIGAGLFVRSLAKLYAFDAGFERSRVLLVNVHSTGPSGQRGRHEELDARMAALPGVRSTTVLMDAPLGGTSVTMNIGVPGQSKEAEEQANFNFVGPRFLETMGIPLVEGRDIRATDSAGARPVAVISESLASRLFRGRGAVGESIQAGGRLVEIVGVAKGVTYAGLRRDKELMVYRPYVQEPAFVARVGLTLALRTEAAPGLLAEEVRRVVREVAPTLLVSSMTTLDARFDGSIATERLLATISGFLGGTALLLVAIGVYGTLAYALAQRTRELGVRMALGATGIHIARLVMGGALVPVAAGVAVGLPIALWMSRIAQSTLFGITPHDTVTYVASTAVLVAVATAAASLPARAAVRTDPTTSLRHN